MALNVALALALSGLIGVSLGLIGGGGSIITVPILVYVAGLPPKEAITMSLAVVGATSLAGGVVQAVQGNVHKRALWTYAVAGMAGAQVGAPLTRLVPSSLLMVLFATLMIFVAVRMLRGRRSGDGVPEGVCHIKRCLATGFGVGVLTGFLGVGGGFLIVPALTTFVRLPMRTAVGTSLLIIALNSASGFLGHIAEGMPDMALAAGFMAAALAGMGIGLVLSRRMKPAGLKAAFAGLSLAVAAFLLVRNAPDAMAMATKSLHL